MKNKSIKARLMFMAPNGTACDTVQCTGDVPVAVLPTRTRQQAQAIVRFARLTEEQGVEAVARVLANFEGRNSWVAVSCYMNRARAILRMQGLLGEGAK